MDWHAHFISSPDASGTAPLFRREFVLERRHGHVESAELAVTALGVIEPYLNGRTVSKAVLTPGWTSYEWRLRVARFDVASLLAENNVLGLLVGNGWFRGHLGAEGESGLYGDKLAAFAELTVTYSDGAIQRISTDETWTTGPSSILTNDLYDGVTIDARRRDDSWLLFGFEDESWAPVKLVEWDQSTLCEYVGPKTSRRQRLSAQKIWTSPSGRTLVDFGQNLVGWIKLWVRGSEGAEVVIRHAEVLEDGELGTRPLRGAKATDKYILSGGNDVFEPTLTLHGFRYAEVVGWPGKLTTTDLTAVVVGSELERIGTFTCSEPLLNRLHENVVWGMRGNFVDLPTDCPQRDERLGWTGDIAAFAPTAAFLFDINDFLRDWLLDLSEEQAHHDGVVPLVIPDILQKPHSAENLPRDVVPAALWSDAAVWVPWAIWKAYGDRRVLHDQFPSMLAHLRKVESLLSPSGLWDTGFQFGDWLDPSAPPTDPAAAKADPGVVATACIYRSARIAAEAARTLGRSEATELVALGDRLRDAFNRNYVRDGRITSDAATAYSLAIVFGLLGQTDQDSAGARLAELVQEASYHVSTGFAGTPFITDALALTGHLDDAYKLLMQTENPSWLYAVTMGATTVWERWDSMLPDGRVNPGEMTSFNHYAFGAVADWMHRVIGGIAPLTPGYARVLLAPQPGGGLTWASTSLRTQNGTVSLKWRLEEKHIVVDAEVPGAAVATLRLPGQPDMTLDTGSHSLSLPFHLQARTVVAVDPA
jgi:alpha-L-rhamnosidase